MQLVSTPKATDGTLYVVQAVFTDEDGDSVSPDSITWSLTDIGGTVINDRYQEAVAVPTASIEIPLMGDDIQAAKGEKFIVTIESLYTSSTYGANQELNDQATFQIKAYTPVIDPS